MKRFRYAIALVCCLLLYGSATVAQTAIEPERMHGVTTSAPDTPVQGLLIEALKVIITLGGLVIWNKRNGEKQAEASAKKILGKADNDDEEVTITKLFVPLDAKLAAIGTSISTIDSRQEARHTEMSGKLNRLELGLDSVKQEVADVSAKSQAGITAAKLDIAKLQGMIEATKPNA